jgi:Mg-chelatase subunit ChlD
MKSRLLAIGSVVLLALVPLVVIFLMAQSPDTTFSRIGYGLSGDGPADGMNFATGTDTTGERLSGPAAESTATTGSSSAYDRPPAMSKAPEMDASIGRGEPEAAPAAGGGVAAESSMNAGNPYRQYQSSLTAGQVDDNDRFQEYMEYLGNYSPYMGGVERIDVSQRMFVRVLDGDQKPVAGARVQLYEGQRQVFDGQSTSDGRVLFFPSAAGVVQANSLRAIVTRGDASAEAALEMGKRDAQVILPGLSDNTGPVGIDLVFLLDATGSMSDEIDRIKGTIGSIASRIEQLPGSSAPRLALVAFRDLGDEYVTRTWDFTSDVDRFSSYLSNVQAGGGGDTPESVNQGLREAINLQGWADNSAGRRLRLVVLVGDAPPHIDYSNDIPYPVLLGQAVARGIKIFPVGASNLDEAGEYVFRQFAQVTLGQFVFLTYANGVSGAPGVYTDKSVTDFTVQNLDNLIVNLVAGEVSNQTGQKIEVTRQPDPVPVVMHVEEAAPVGLLDRLFGGEAAVWWAGLLGVIALVVWATGTQARARVAPRPAPLAPAPAQTALDLFLLAPTPEQADLAAPEQEREEEYAEAAFVAPPAPYPLEMYVAGRDYEREHEGTPTVRIG